jgi:hypothetical protein
MEMTDAEKDALIDHELEHIEVKMDGKRPKLDCRGRPKIGMRKHDYQFGWFRSIAERHGVASGEVHQARTLFLREKQTFFAFINQPAALPFQDLCKEHGETVEIRTGSKSVKIDGDGIRKTEVSA